MLTEKSLTEKKKDTSYRDRTYHKIKITLHPSLRIEIQGHRSSFLIYEERLQLHAVETLG